MAVEIMIFIVRLTAPDVHSASYIVAFSRS